MYIPASSDTLFVRPMQRMSGDMLFFCVSSAPTRTIWYLSFDRISERRSKSRKPFRSLHVLATPRTIFLSPRPYFSANPLFIGLNASMSIPLRITWTEYLSRNDSSASDASHSDGATIVIFLTPVNSSRFLCRCRFERLKNSPDIFFFCGRKQKTISTRTPQSKSRVAPLKESIE